MDYLLLKFPINTLLDLKLVVGKLIYPPAVSDKQEQLLSVDRSQGLYLHQDLSVQVKKIQEC